MKRIWLWALAFAALTVTSCSSDGFDSEGYVTHADSTGVEYRYRVAQDTLREGDAYVLPQVLVFRKAAAGDAITVFNPSEIYHDVIDYDTEELIDKTVDGDYLIYVGRFRWLEVPPRDDEYGHFPGEPESNEYYVVGINMTNPKNSFYISPCTAAKFNDNRSSVEYTIDGKNKAKLLNDLPAVGTPFDVTMTSLEAEAVGLD